MGGREGDDDVVEKVLWFSKGKTFKKNDGELDLNVVFLDMDMVAVAQSRQGLFWYRICVG